MNCYPTIRLIFSRQYHLTMKTTKRIFTEEDDMSFVKQSPHPNSCQEMSSKDIPSCIGFQFNEQIKCIPMSSSCINAVIWRQLKIIPWRQHHEFEFDICPRSKGLTFVIYMSKNNDYRASKMVRSCYLHIR